MTEVIPTERLYKDDSNLFCLHDEIPEIINMYGCSIHYWIKILLQKYWEVGVEECLCLTRKQLISK